MMDIRGNLKTFSKQKIAIEYLNLALSEYIKGKNLFAVLNLSAAAEEILGKLVELNNDQNAYQSALDWMSRWHTQFKLETPKKSILTSFIYKAKNGVKHLDGESDISIELDIYKEVKESIRRALENYNKIDGLIPTAEMLAYYQHIKT